MLKIILSINTRWSWNSETGLCEILIILFDKFFSKKSFITKWKTLWIMHITRNVSPKDILNIHVIKKCLLWLIYRRRCHPYCTIYSPFNWHLYSLGHRGTDANNPVIVKHEQIVMFSLSGFCLPQQAWSSGQFSQLSQARASFTSHTKHGKMYVDFFQWLINILSLNNLLCKKQVFNSKDSFIWCINNYVNVN